MARTLAPQLAEALDVIEWYSQLVGRVVARIELFHARQMQHGVEQHRRVPNREHKPVAVRPSSIFRIERQKPLPQLVGNRSHAHRRARMSRVRLLYSIHRERAYRINAKCVQLLSARRSNGSHRSSA